MVGGGGTGLTVARDSSLMGGGGAGPTPARQALAEELLLRAVHAEPSVMVQPPDRTVEYDTFIKSQLASRS
jgi:hypothetical protein